MNADRINYLNIGLMVLSAGLALAWPFEAFLVAYALLGPLHYLTEISWLHDRNYYTQGGNDYLFLVGISVFVSLIFFDWLPFAPKNTAEFLSGWALAAALSFALLKTPAVRWMAIVPAGLAAFILLSVKPCLVFFGMFLPTLAHVFLFTGMFILAGALRGRSFSGLLSLLIFLALPIGLLWWHPVHPGYLPGPYVRDSYGVLKEDGTSSSPFIAINYYVMQAFHLHDFSHSTVGGLAIFIRDANDFLYQNPLALSFMSFVAFAYLYHYFNWFSKTSIIGWHQIPRRRAIALLSLWGVSLALYSYSYSVGLKWLFFLSFTHVLLEFPLNQLTWIGIGREARKWVVEARRPGQVKNHNTGKS